MPMAVMECSDGGPADSANGSALADRDTGKHGTRNGAASRSYCRTSDNATGAARDCGSARQRQYRRCGYE